MLEIEAAKIAQQKGNADEKKFAEQMITDHTKTSTELKGLVPADMKSAITTALDDSSPKKLDKLRDTKPEDFASQYEPMQVSAHKDAVSLFERYANGGDNDQLKGWASKTLPALQHHLEMAQAMDKNRKWDSAPKRDRATLHVVPQVEQRCHDKKRGYHGSQRTNRRQCP